MINPERQQNWGWPAAIYVFLAGTGGGVFLLSLILNGMGWYEPVARIGALIGPLLVWMGTLFLLMDLGSVAKVYRLFSSASPFRTSWMARGAWILTAFVICGLAYSLPLFRIVSMAPLNPNINSRTRLGSPCRSAFRGRSRLSRLSLRCH